MKRLGELSQRYVSRGDGRDYDEFRSELRRVEVKQREQLLERYIRDLQRRYPYRHIRYDPARHERVTRLVDRAITEQQAANVALQLQNDQLREKLDSIEEKDMIAAADGGVTQQAQTDDPSFLTQAATYLPLLLMIVGALLLVLVVTLVYAIVKVTSATASVTQVPPNSVAKEVNGAPNAIVASPAQVNESV